MGAAFCAGLLVGLVVSELMWRLLRRLERKLIDEQAKLLEEQSAVIAWCNTIFRASLSRARGEEQS